MAAGVHWQKVSVALIASVLCLVGCTEPPKAPSLVQLHTPMGVMTVSLLAQQEALFQACQTADAKCQPALSWVQQDVCIGIDLPCSDTVFTLTKTAVATLNHVRGAVFLMPDGPRNRFFIVQGKPQTLQALQMHETRTKRILSTTDRDRYMKYGGAPQFDGQATPIGVVVDGLEVIDKLAALPTDAQKKPLAALTLKYVPEVPK